MYSVPKTQRESAKSVYDHMARTPHRLVMILVHGGLWRERKNTLPTRTQHGRRPRRQLNRAAIVISETVDDADLRTARS
ncbi:MAG: hypothetical protein DME82_16065 [Verrucomicrobia bacterium]|nr:MAG: hypothetical protein DME82_16065 [Verrucomicrobiota bacterium]